MKPAHQMSTCDNSCACIQSRLDLSLLAEHLGLERSQRRLLAVLRKDCTPRLGMRARLWLDVTDNDAFETNIAGLVYELRQSSQA